jgi:hypothetical protein
VRRIVSASPASLKTKSSSGLKLEATGSRSCALKIEFAPGHAPKILVAQRLYEQKAKLERSRHG